MLYCPRKKYISVIVIIRYQLLQLLYIKISPDFIYFDGIVRNNNIIKMFNLIFKLNLKWQGKSRLFQAETALLYRVIIFNIVVKIIKKGYE